MGFLVSHSDPEYQDSETAHTRIGVNEVAAKLTTYDPAEDLTSDKAVAIFMAEAFGTGDAGYIAHALGVVARARGMLDTEPDNSWVKQPSWTKGGGAVAKLKNSAPTVTSHNAIARSGSGAAGEQRRSEHAHVDGARGRTTGRIGGLVQQV